MKYQYQPLSKTSAIIEINPETDIEIKLLKDIDRSNPDHEFTLHYYYESALQSRNGAAVLLSIDRFIQYPTKGVISFKVVTGLGG
ncbi:hypothetical protein [Pedobacter jeongneungensis]|uniref:hypothetical protein n=1 Tax=Pedobacter jeongneungensis TaxID=947309 RepID=UPI00046AAFA4|nr:hypothetical protein [Pedobacter jeongneungensis]